MKNKDYIICGLLAAILAICCLTSYILILEQKKQSEIQLIQTEAILEICDQVENEETGLGKSIYIEKIDELWKRIYEIKD